MLNLVGAVLISAAIYLGFRHMTEAVTAALANLTSEVTETIADVSAKLADLANNTDDEATAAAIKAQADRLDAFQASLNAPAEPAPAGDDTQAG